MTLRQHPFLVFVAVVGSMIAAMIWFIQSPRFARTVKGVLAKHLPANLGVEGDFSDLSVRLFPPGISVNRARLELRAHNILGLPAGSELEAERVTLAFGPFQMFSGNIWVNEVTITKGNVVLVTNRALAPPVPPTSRGSGSKTPGLAEPAFHWDELFHIHAEAVALEDTRVEIRLAPRSEDAPAPGINFVGPLPESAALLVDLLAESLRVGQWSGHGGLGYELELGLRDVHVHRLAPEWLGTRLSAQLEAAGLNGRPLVFQRVRGNAHLNALGMELGTLDVAMTEPSLDFTLSGQAKGNILKPKNLSFDLHSELSADLATLAPMPDQVAGRFRFRGQVTGNLEKILETIKADGSVEVDKARFRSWTADRVALEGVWHASGGTSGGAGEVSFTRGEIVEREQPRIPAAQGASRVVPGHPGEGGRVEIGAFKFPLDLKHSFTVPLTLEHAHVHWLAAPAIAKIFPLSFRASGNILATFSPADSALGPKAKWSIGTKLKLAVADLLLDNQKQFEAKPQNKIIEVHEVLVEGDAMLDDSGVSIDGIDLALPTSKFHATGRIGLETGFDLHALGRVDLKDIGRIADNDIRGEGELDVRVHGPASRVFIDFDADLKGAAYLNLNLGDLKGRITWDDDPDHLIFSSVSVAKGLTHYQGDGVIDIRQDTLDLNFTVPQGDIRDFSDIFAHMTEGVWWYPRTVNGPVSGNVHVFGGLSLKKLVVAAKLAGNRWEYLGERFQTVTLAGGFERGKYQITELKLLKRLGTLTGHVSVDAEDRFDWGFQGSGLTLSDIDHIASLDVPIRGKISAKSSGSGVLGRIVSSTEVALTDAAIHGSGLPPSQLVVRSENGVTTLEGVALGGSGQLDLTYDFKDGGHSALRAEARRLDFSPILLLLNPKAIDDAALMGYVSGSANLTFRSGQVERASGNLELSEYELAKSGARFGLVRPVEVKVQDGTFEVHELALRGPQGEASLEMRGRPTGIEGKIVGQLDLAIAEFVTPTIMHSNGVLDLDFDIGGLLKDPTFIGKATLSGNSLQISALDSPIENLTGAFALRQNVVTVENLEGELAGGRIRGEGTVTVFASRYPVIDLRGFLLGNKLPVYPFQFVHAKGNLAVKGVEPPYLVSGSIVVDSALSKTPMLGQSQQQGMKAVQYNPPPSARLRSGDSLFKLDIAAKADQGILVQNDLFDAEFKGAVTIVNTLEAPRLLGNAEMVQGRIIFKDRIFQIQSFSATFDNPTVIDPSFSLTANTEINRVKIQLFATGRISERRMELTSNPSMPESEIVSLLALGLTADDSKRLGVDRTLMEQGEAASLLLNSLDFNRQVKDKTGIEIQLDESVASQIGTSISRLSTSTEPTAAPRIVLRRKLGSNVDLTARSTVGVGALNEREVNAEVHVTPGLSVIGVWDQQETLGPEGSTNGTYGSYGVDFKVQKRFK